MLLVVVGRAHAAAAGGGSPSRRLLLRNLPQQQQQLLLRLQRWRSSQTSDGPPRARREAGQADPYAWMEARTEEVLQHLDAENRFSDRAMVGTHHLQATLFREMRAALRVVEDEGPEAAQQQQQQTMGEPGGDGYRYYSRRARGQNFPVFCRRPEGNGGNEEVLLDQNAWPTVFQQRLLGDAKVSPRHGRLAFVLGEADKGERGWTLYVQDLKGGKWWTTEGGAWAGVGTSFEWGPALGDGEDGNEEEEVLYYTKTDEHGRPHEVWAAYLPQARQVGLSRPLRRVLRLDPARDRAFFLTVTRTKDRRFVTLAVTSKASSEAWLLPGPAAAKLRRPEGKDEELGEEARPRLFRPRRPGIQYFVEHGTDAFFVVANEAPGGEYGLYTLPTSDGETPASSWRPCPSASSSSSGGGGGGGGGGDSIEDVDLFRDFCVVYERVEGAPSLRVLDRRDGAHLSSHRPDLPQEVSTGRLQPGLNQDYHADRVRFSVTSPILPDVAYEYDMVQRRLHELRRERLPGRPPLSATTSEGRFRCHRVLVPSSSISSSSHGHGGNDDERIERVEIPLTLAHRSDVRPNPGQQHPVLLLGYGAYGVCLGLGFRPELLPLLERGWVVAFAHVRGGGEKARRWHAEGKGAKKLNSVLDYLDCADWLVREGWTRPGLIAGHGASAGALVVAGAAHRRPELLGAMVLKVPFLDLHRTMMDRSLPLTVHEADEWGDPAADPAVAARLAQLSPYDTVPAHAPCFPSTLLLASLVDDKVKGWEAAKYAAKARSMRLSGPGSSDDSHALAHAHPEVLLRMEGDRGHEGPPSQAGMLLEAAYEQAFVLTRLGLMDTTEKEGSEPKHRVGRAGRRKSRHGEKGAGRFLEPVPPLVFW